MQRQDFTNELVLWHFDKSREGTNNLLFSFATKAPQEDKALTFPAQLRANMGWPNHVHTMFDYRTMFGDIYDRLFQFCVISLCSDFEAFTKAVFEKYGYKKGNGAFFQRIDDVILRLEGEGFNFLSIKNSLDKLRLAFQVRHIGIHNIGIVDQGFNDKTGQGIIGQPYPIDEASYREMYSAYTAFLKHLDDSLPILPV
ncbi:hypothetical protein QZM46_16300 [Burkholderia vietnamiensis]|uniref:hypothetical protein n=1 Tax=Burkholderia cepacia complex TaxID=87882 RepID=UPI0026544432|nr:hypothetical protein [Burkholderia vietnamiensis]MDN7552882.1 hypothetical protein [Burkholderia vietnamiensis]HDR9093073.1 hypothetical protein [Burkholderia vietnamiensis]